MKKRRRSRKLSQKTLNKLTQRAEIEGAKFGRLLGSPEDARQEYLTRVLEGKHKHATVQQAMIDIARDVGGRGPTGTKQKRDVVNAIPVSGMFIETVLGAREMDLDTRIFIQEVLRTLKPQQRRVIELQLRGMTNKEIAALEEFDCTESRVSQIFQKAVLTIREKLRITS